MKLLFFLVIQCLVATSGFCQVKVISLPSNTAAEIVLQKPKTVLNNTAYVADTSGKIWGTDGTPGGTFLLHDLTSDPDLVFSEFDGKIFFNKNGYIYSTNGNPETTYKIYKGSYSDFPVVAINGQYYSILEDTARKVVSLLWTDGTTIGTRIIQGLLPDSCTIERHGLFNYKNNLYYVINKNSKVCLYKTDLTEGKSLKVATLYSFFNGIINPGDFDNKYIAANGFIYTSLNSLQRKFQFWRTDGSEKGTEILHEFDSIINNITVTYFNNAAYFFIKKSGNIWELWSTKNDFTEFFKLKEIESTGQPKILPTNETLFLCSKYEIFCRKVEGEFSSIYNSRGNMFETLVKEKNNELLVFESLNEGGLKIVSIDGVNQRMIDSINLPIQGSQFTLSGSNIYFLGYDEEHGREVWITNGKEAHLVADIYDGKTSSAPSDFVPLGEELLFTANDGIDGKKLYITQSNNVASLTENIEPAYFFLFPTMTDDKISWNLPRKDLKRITLSGIAGEVLHEEIFDQQTSINVSEFPDGMYIISFSGEGWSIKRKFIIHN